MQKVVADYFPSLFASENLEGFESALVGLEKLVSNKMNAVLDEEP